jgi:hypothetical protein
MPEYRVVFETPKPNSMLLPHELLSAGGRYRVDVLPDGSVDVQGNRDGLLYLANILVQCALAGYYPGWHAHFRLDSNDHTPPSAAPELTLYAADPAFPSTQG